MSLTTGNKLWETELLNYLHLHSSSHILCPLASHILSLKLLGIPTRRTKCLYNLECWVAGTGWALCWSIFSPLTMGIVNFVARSWKIYHIFLFLDVHFFLREKNSWLNMLCLFFLPQQYVTKCFQIFLIMVTKKNKCNYFLTALSFPVSFPQTKTTIMLFPCYFVWLGLGAIACTERVWNCWIDGRNS